MKTIIFRWLLLVFIPAGVILTMACQTPVLSGEGKEADQEAKQTAQQLDLYTANLFHRCLSVVAHDAHVGVWYDGSLRHPMQAGGGPAKWAVDTDVRWSVTTASRDGGALEEIIFKIKVSLKKEADSIAVCTVNGKKLYLQAFSHKENWTVDTVLSRHKEKEWTARKLLKHLEELGEQAEDFPYNLKKQKE